MHSRPWTCKLRDCTVIVMMTVALCHLCSGFSVQMGRAVNTSGLWPLQSVVIYISYAHPAKEDFTVRVTAQFLAFYTESCQATRLAERKYDKESAPFDRGDYRENYYVEVEYMFQIEETPLEEGERNTPRPFEIVVSGSSDMGKATKIVKVFATIVSQCLNWLDFSLTVDDHVTQLQDEADGMFGTRNRFKISSHLVYTVTDEERPWRPCDGNAAVSYEIHRLSDDYRLGYCTMPAMMGKVNLVALHKRLSFRKLDVDLNVFQLHLAPYVMPTGYFRFRLSVRDLSCPDCRMTLGFYQYMWTDDPLYRRILPVIDPPSPIVDTRFHGRAGLDASQSIIIDRLPEAGFVESRTSKLVYGWKCQPEAACVKTSGPRLKLAVRDMHIKVHVTLTISYVQATLDDPEDGVRRVRSAPVNVDILVFPDRHIHPVAIRCVHNCLSLARWEQRTMMMADFMDSSQCQNYTLEWDDPARSSRVATYPPTWDPHTDVATLKRTSKAGKVESEGIPLTTYFPNKKVSKREDVRPINFTAKLTSSHAQHCVFSFTLGLGGSAVSTDARQAPLTYRVVAQGGGDLQGLELYHGMSPHVERVALPLVPGQRFLLLIYSVSHQLLGRSLSQPLNSSCLTPRDANTTMLSITKAALKTKYTSYTLHFALAHAMSAGNFKEDDKMKTASLLLEDMMSVPLMYSTTDMAYRTLLLIMRGNMSLTYTFIDQALAFYNATKTTFEEGSLIDRKDLHARIRTMISMLMTLREKQGTSFGLRIKHDEFTVHSIFESTLTLGNEFPRFTQELYSQDMDTQPWLIVTWWGVYLPSVEYDIAYKARPGGKLPFRSIHLKSQDIFNQRRVSDSCDKTLAFTLFASRAPFMDDGLPENLVNLGFTELFITDKNSSERVHVRGKDVNIEVAWITDVNYPYKSIEVNASVDAKGDVVVAPCPIILIPASWNATIRVDVEVEGNRSFYYNLGLSRHNDEMLHRLAEPMHAVGSRAVVWCPTISRKDAYLFPNAKCVLRVAIAVPHVISEGTESMQTLKIYIRTISYMCFSESDGRLYVSDSCEVMTPEDMEEGKMACRCSQNTAFSGSIAEQTSHVALYSPPSPKPIDVYNMTALTATVITWMLLLAALKYSRWRDRIESGSDRTRVLRGCFRWRSHDRYLLGLCTSPMVGAGTHNDLYFALIGTHGCTRSISVKNELVFSAGCQFWCVLSTRIDIGKILGVILKLDNHETEASSHIWQLTDVVVYKLSTESLEVCKVRESLRAGQEYIMTPYPFPVTTRARAERRFKRLIRLYHSVLSITLHIPGAKFSRTKRVQFLMAVAVFALLSALYYRGFPRNLEGDLDRKLPLKTVARSTLFVSLSTALFASVLSGLFSKFFPRAYRVEWPNELPAETLRVSENIMEKRKRQEKSLPAKKTLPRFFQRKKRKGDSAAVSNDASQRNSPPLDVNVKDGEDGVSQKEGDNQVWGVKKNALVLQRDLGVVWRGVVDPKKAEINAQRIKAIRMAGMVRGRITEMFSTTQQHRASKQHHLEEITTAESGDGNSTSSDDKSEREGGERKPVKEVHPAELIDFRRFPRYEEQAQEPAMSESQRAKFNLKGPMFGSALMSGLIWLYIIGASFVIATIGSQYAYNESWDWFFMGTGGLALSIVVWEPLIIFSRACFDASVRKLPHPLQEEATKRAEAFQQSCVMRQNYEVEGAAYSSNESLVRAMYRVASVDCRHYLITVIKQLRAQKAMRRCRFSGAYHNIWYSLLLVVTCVMAVSMHAETANGFHQAQYLRHLFKIDMFQKQITKAGMSDRHMSGFTAHTIDGIWDYIDNVFVKGVALARRGRRIEDTANIMLTSVARLSQRRAVPIDDCLSVVRLPRIQNIPVQCNYDMIYMEEETRDFLPEWKPFDPKKRSDPAFMFTDIGVAEYLLSWAHPNHFGGYTIMLPADEEVSRLLVRDAHADQWIDENTKQLTLDLTIYNPDTGMASTVEIVFNFYAAGIFRHSSVASFIYSSKQYYLNLLVKVLYALTLINMWRAVTMIYANGFRKFVKEMDGWFRLIKLVLSMALSAGFILKAWITQTTSKKFVNTVLGNRKYLDFIWLQDICVLVNVLGGTLSLVMMWYFFNLASIFDNVYVMRSMANNVLPLLVLPFVCIVVFSSFAYLVFNTFNERFADPLVALSQISQEVISISRIHRELLKQSPIMASLFTVAFFVGSVLIVFNFMLSAVGTAYNDVRVYLRRMRFYKTVELQPLKGSSSKKQMLPMTLAEVIKRVKVTMFGDTQGDE